MDGMVLVLAGSSKLMFEILEGPADADDDALIDALNDVEGVAEAHRYYGEFSLLISLEGVSEQEYRQTGDRLVELAAGRGYRWRQVIVVG